MGFDHVGGSYGCFDSDVYETPEKAKEASINDNYDDETSNEDWRKNTNKIIELWDETKKTEIQVQSKNEST